MSSVVAVPIILRIEDAGKKAGPRFQAFAAETLSERTEELRQMDNRISNARKGWVPDRTYYPAPEGSEQTSYESALIRAG